MPTYEYKCDSCGHQFDVYQSMKDDKLTKCPDCGKETLRRLIGTGSGLIFKGSGFYLTDYKNKPSEKTATSHATSNTGTGKTESPASEKNVSAETKNNSSSESSSSGTKSYIKSDTRKDTSSGSTSSSDSKKSKGN